MKEEEIRQTLFGLLRNIAPDTEPDKLNLSDNIRKTLAIDSFDYLQFIVGMDEKFSIQTPEEDYGKIETLADLISYIVTKAKKD
jgi:acyl carrier protein